MAEAQGNKKLKEDKETLAKGKIGTRRAIRAYYETMEHGCASHICTGDRLRFRAKKMQPGVTEEASC